MEAMRLIAEARGVGLTVLAEGDSLVVRGPRSAETIARRLLDRKADVMAALRQEERRTGNESPYTAVETAESAGIDAKTIFVAPGETILLVPEHPLAGFDWESSNGYCPGLKIVRDGVEHKSESCTSDRSWLSVWGGRYCLDCWPPTDARAIASEGGASRAP
jgi:hypothetical protein